MLQPVDDSTNGNPLLELGKRHYEATGQIHPLVQPLLDSMRKQAQPSPEQLGTTGGSAPTLVPPQPQQPPLTQRTTMTPGATTPAPQPGAHQQELTRLTTGESGKSGIEQIHNPWLRVPLQVLDAIGTGFAPRLTSAIPGTELHHRALVGQQEKAVNEDETLANNQQRRQLEQAQTENYGSEVQAREHPKPKLGNPIATDKGFVVPNDTEGTAAPLMVNGEQAKPAEKPERQATPFSDWRDHNPDAPISEWFKTEQAGKPPAHKSAEDRYMEEFAQTHPGSKVADAVRAYAKDHETPQRPPQALMVDPTTQTAVGIGPGSHVPQGAMTPGGVNSVNVPTGQTRTMAETAPKVLDLAARAGQLIDQQVNGLGPLAGRWSEFMAGKVGAPNPEFTKLRTDIGLLQTALMRMHVGARGGEQMMEHFRNLIDVAKQDPENLKAALEEITAYAKEVGASGRAQPGEQQPQSGGNMNSKKVWNDKTQKFE